MRLVDRHIGEVGEQLRAAVVRRPSGAQVRPLVDERGGRAAGDEVGLLENPLQEGDIGGNATDAELGQRPSGAGHRGREIAPAAGELDEHRVEVRAHLSADEDRATVQSHAGATRAAVCRDLAGVGAELVRRVLGRNAALQGGPAQGDRVLADPEVREGLARGDPQLRGHQVDVGYFLGDRVLDLDARVHLDEDVAAVLGEEELHRAGVDVTDLAGERDGVGTHLVAQRRVEVGRRSDLDDLLVAALDRTVALEEVHDVADRIGEDLHLDVAGADHRLLDEDRRVAEGRLGFAHRRGQRAAQVCGSVDPTHAAAAATGDRLDEHGEPDLLGARDEGLDIGAGRATAQRRQAGAPSRLDGPRLVAGEVQDRSRRTDEDHAGALARLGEVGVLGQEAVSGIDRLGAARDGHLDDGPRIQVGTDGMARLTDLVGLVGLEPMLAGPVLMGEHRDRLRAQLGRCPERADRDLSAVGHQDLAEHVSLRFLVPVAAA